jgi:hypothetical protein
LGPARSGKLTAQKINQDYPAATVINNKEATLVAQ